MTAKNKLNAYKKRRHFAKTPEPIGTKQTPSKRPIFVVQKHAARQLHYDFRLESDGVLKSWAIPKGPSTSPKEKRLAIMTDDHPLAYAHFEGTIPKGEYGAGTVKIWDKGTYRNLKKKNGKIVPIKQCIKNGEIEVWLNGKKLKGGYVLIHFKPEEQSWLFKKMADEKKKKSETKGKAYARRALHG